MSTPSAQPGKEGSVARPGQASPGGMGSVPPFVPPQQSGAPGSASWQALYEQGAAFMQQRKPQQAAEAFHAALRLNPGSIEARINLARMLLPLGRGDEAIAQYQNVLATDPQNLVAMHDLGVTLRHLKRFTESAECLRQVIAADPASAEAHNNLGLALLELHQLPEAESAYRRALELRPTYINAMTNLATCCAQQARLREAVELYRRALAHAPQNPTALNDLALMLTGLRRSAEAVVYARQSVRVDPKFADAHNNLAVALTELGRWRQAEASYERALKIDPNLLTAQINLANFYGHQQRPREAMAAFDLAVWNEPEDAVAHLTQALSLLSYGQFEEGFKAYEWRWKKDPMRSFEQPLWDGSDLTGKRILIWPEQGLGDFMQFVRYVPMMKSRGASQVIVESPVGLVDLARSCKGIDVLYSSGAPADQRPAFDVHLPLMSLPLRFGTTLDTVPSAVPYLSADPVLVDKWREKLAGERKLRIGISWQGNPLHYWDHHRSLPLKHFRHLAKLKNVQLFSLQTGHGSEQVGAPGNKGSLTSLRTPLDPTLPEAASWSNLAALMMNLDLVVTVDTAIAHLAGALGKPVWVLLSRLLDWRWMYEREDSPWYPTMRLFRQRKLDKWRGVFDEIVLAVESLPRDRQS